MVHRDGATDRTVLFSTDPKRAAQLRHGIRRAVFRIVADCERMLESLNRPDRSDWRDAIWKALIASKELLALGGDVERINEPRRRIVDAMARLSAFTATSMEEELLLQDAREIHSLATGLGHESVDRATVEQQASPGNGAKRDRARVLIVDDEPLLQRVIERMVLALGHDVIIAANGSDGLEAAQRERPDVILTDVNMPVMDGLDLLRSLKRDPGTRDIPVLVVSGQDELAVVVECIEAGAEDHIPKPLQPRLLEARMKATLERRRARGLELQYLLQTAELKAATAREDRLQYRLKQLRHELGESSSQLSLLALESAESPYASGEIVASRYEILGHLGRGGMGMVYHARDLELGEELALKVVRQDLVKQDPAILDRLKSEIRLARRISHPNVVRAHDLGEWKGTYFITMEYVRGVTVEELLDRRGRLTVASALAIGTQIAEALAVAHEAQIVHRDIKPANLLVDEAGVLKVMDFGIARSYAPRADADGASGLTAGGFIIGTLRYMAPEQLMGGAADARSDVFATAVVLYECLAGKPPFIGDSPAEIMAQIVDRSWRLRELVPDVPESLERLLMQQMALNPAERCASARTLANRLAEIEHAG